MIPYCSSTGTRTTREKLVENNWRVLWVASGHNWDSKPVIPAGYAIDNGAWSAWLNNRGFNESDFIRCLDFSVQYAGDTGLEPDWVVLPDIVAGGMPSLEYSLRWANTVQPYTKKMLIAVQDGMTPADLRPYVCEEIGLFVGGSTPWKLKTIMAWGALAKDRCYLHVGRVNSIKRISHCASAGAHSFDGTSVCRFPCTLDKLNRARHQIPLPLF